MFTRLNNWQKCMKQLKIVQRDMWLRSVTNGRLSQILKELNSLPFKDLREVFL